MKYLTLFSAVILGVTLAWLSAAPGSDLRQSGTADKTIGVQDNPTHHEPLHKSRGTPYAYDMQASVPPSAVQAVRSSDSLPPSVSPTGGPFLSPEHPIYDEPRQIVNIGSVLDPSDDSNLSNHASDSVRNIGKILDPDD